MNDFRRMSTQCVFQHSPSRVSTALVHTHTLVYAALALSLRRRSYSFSKAPEISTGRVHRFGFGLSSYESE